MHVKRLPEQVFNSFVLEPKVVGVHEYGLWNYPDESIKRLQFDDRVDEKRTIGQTEHDCWLWVRPGIDTSRLGIYPSVEAIMEDEPFSASWQLVAGRRPTGTSVAGSDEYEQTAWVETRPSSLVGQEGLDFAGRSALVAGILAVHARNLLDGDVFETTTHFTNPQDS